MASPGIPTATTYDVYDADVNAPARFFMINKDERGWNPYLASVLQAFQTRSDLKPTNDTIDLAATAAAMAPPSMPPRGGDYRWLLPDDVSGLHALGDMYSYLDNMEYLWNLYFVLQSLVLLMLMVRLMHYVSFQPHLAVIGGAIARAIPMLLYWAVIAGMVVVMLLMLNIIAFGDRLEQLSTISGSAYAVARWLLIKHSDRGNRATITEMLNDNTVILNGGESLVAALVRGLGAIFILFVLYAFVFAILLRQQRMLRRWRHAAPTVGEDLRHMFRWWVQRSWRDAPSNKRLDLTIDWVTRPEVRYTWAYSVLYSAVVRGVAAVAGGTALAKRHPTQHQAVTERAVLLPGGPPGFNSPDEPDPRYCPRYNLRAMMMVFEELLLVNKELRRELFFFMQTNNEDGRTKRMKAMGAPRRAAAAAAVNDASARAMADSLASLLLERFGKRVPRRAARSFDEMMHQLRKRLGTPAGGSGSADGSEFSGSLDGGSARGGDSENSDDDMLPTGVRVGSLKHRGYGVHNQQTVHDLQLQAAVQTAMRNIHTIRENMGRELGDDPQLLATLFVAQFAGQIPEPERRPPGVRPSLYRQRVQQAGSGNSLVNVGAGSAPAPAAPGGPPRPGRSRLGGAAMMGQSPQAAPAPTQGPVAAVLDTNTPEGMLTKALQAMLAPPSTTANAAVSADGTVPAEAEASSASVTDGAPRARPRPKGAKSRARFAADLEIPGNTTSTAGEEAPASPGVASPGAVGSPSGRHNSVSGQLGGSRTARSMLPRHLQPEPRAASFAHPAPATLGSLGQLGSPSSVRSSRSMVMPAGSGSAYFTPSASMGGAAGAATAPGGPTASTGGTDSGAAPQPEPLTIRRPQIHKMRSLGAAAAVAGRMRSFVSGAPGEITPASPTGATSMSAAAAAASLITSPGSYGRSGGSTSMARSGVATPRGDLVSAQISALPLDGTIIFATSAAVVQRLTSHVLQLLRELRGVQADADAMLRSTLVLIERLSAGSVPFPRRAARMVPGVMGSPASSPPVSPQNEKPPGWEDAAVARVAAANAAAAAQRAAVGTASPRLGSSLRVRVEDGAGGAAHGHGAAGANVDDGEDMLPLPPPPALRGVDSYTASPRSLAALQAARGAAGPLSGLLTPPTPTPEASPEKALPPAAAKSAEPAQAEEAPAGESRVVSRAASQAGMKPVDEMREVEPEPELVTFMVQSGMKSRAAGDAAALAAGTLGTIV